jgi:hypothetical protein
MEVSYHSLFIVLSRAELQLRFDFRYWLMLNVYCRILVVLWVIILRGHCWLNRLSVSEGGPRTGGWLSKLIWWLKAALFLTYRRIGHLFHQCRSIILFGDHTRWILNGYLEISTVHHHLMTLLIYPLHHRGCFFLDRACSYTCRHGPSSVCDSLGHLLFAILNSRDRLFSKQGVVRTVRCSHIREGLGLRFGEEGRWGFKREKLRDYYTRFS